MPEINEPDWKVLRRVHPLARERFCERVLAEINRVSRDGAKSYHARYLQIFRIIQQRDREIARLFDNRRRSHALTMLAQTRSQGLLTEDEFSSLCVQADMLSDSILSFNTIHDRVKRCETAGLRDGTWVRDELATQAGLDIQSPGFARDLWHAAQQSYSLELMMAVVKFGPHHVVVQTPSEQHSDHDVLRG